MSPQYPTREQCFENAARILARGLLEVLASDPREAAERAYMPKVTASVDELEARIRKMQEDKIAALSAAA